MIGKNVIMMHLNKINGYQISLKCLALILTRKKLAISVRFSQYLSFKK